jgi:hypothetical protein
VGAKVDFSADVTKLFSRKVISDGENFNKKPLPESRQRLFSMDFGGETTGLIVR